MKSFISFNNLGRLRYKLHEWFEQNCRALPFRESRNPYLIWLSEVIMQQTRMQQGLPYFKRFSEKYPTVTELAKAQEDEILKLWQGLGYYSRARNLHAAAKQIQDQFAGVFPQNYKDLLQLKGVGPYTAAAIASIAYNEPVAVVDGNVQRVLSRLTELDLPVNSPAGQAKIQTLAGHFLDPLQPGKHNEALMELGALVCTPSNPSCALCPFQGNCMAFQNHSIHLFPVKLPKKKVQPLFFLYVVIEHQEHILIRKRTEPGIWHMLHEPPLLEIEKELSSEYLAENIEECLKKWKIDIRNAEIIQSERFEHLLTHRFITAYFVHLRVSSLTFDSKELISADRNQIRYTYAVTRLFSKFLETSGLWKNDEGEVN